MSRAGTLTPTTAVVDPRDTVDTKADVIPTAPSHRGIPQSQAPTFHREVRQQRDPNSGRTLNIAGRLSRQGMEQAIAAGYSVHLPTNNEDGSTGLQLITKVDQIPSDAELAERFGESSNVDSIRARNEAEIQRMQQENQRLTALQNRAPAAPQQKPEEKTGSKAR